MLSSSANPLQSQRSQSRHALLDATDGVFSRSGGEAGLNTYIEYQKEGGGYAVLINSDVEDGPLDDLMVDVAALVGASGED